MGGESHFCVRLLEIGCCVRRTQWRSRKIFLEARALSRQWPGVRGWLCEIRLYRTRYRACDSGEVIMERVDPDGPPRRRMKQLATASKVEKCHSRAELDHRSRPEEMENESWNIHHLDKFAESRCPSFEQHFFAFHHRDRLSHSYREHASECILQSSPR